MIRIVCPACSMVLLTEPVDEHPVQTAAEAPAHA